MAGEKKCADRFKVPSSCFGLFYFHRGTVSLLFLSSCLLCRLRYLCGASYLPAQHCKSHRSEPCEPRFRHHQWNCECDLRFFCVTGPVHAKNNDLNAQQNEKL